MHMHSQHAVQRVTILGHIGILLLIYLKPSEVYQIFLKLVDNTGRIKNNAQEKNRLRWHIPKDEFDQGQLISAFIDTWRKGSTNKKLLKHFFDTGLNLDMILHSFFNTLMQSVMTLEQSMHIMINFLLEG